MKNKLFKNVFCLLLVRPLSASSNAFENGARMSGVCAFIADKFECEHKTLLIYRLATLIFRTYLCGIVWMTIKQLTQWLNVISIVFLTSTSWDIHVYMFNNNIHWAANLFEICVCLYNCVANLSTLLQLSRQNIKIITNIINLSQHLKHILRILHSNTNIELVLSRLAYPSTLRNILLYATRIFAILLL